jgi:hypothetical protein
MALEFVRCPVCSQRLALQAYVLPGTLVVCANPKCNTNMRVTTRRPIHIELVPENQTYTSEYRPESYG